MGHNSSNVVGPLVFSTRIMKEELQALLIIPHFQVLDNNVEVATDNIQNSFINANENF